MLTYANKSSIVDGCSAVDCISVNGFLFRTMSDTILGFVLTCVLCKVVAECRVVEIVGFPISDVDAMSKYTLLLDVVTVGELRHWTTVGWGAEYVWDLRLLWDS